jgi:hypothetical protein
VTGGHDVSLLYKPDWEETKEHFNAWWAHEAIGRAAIAVTAPRANPPALRRPTPPADPAGRWTDLDYIAARNEYEHATTFYGGEAFPIWNAGYAGQAAIPAFLGCPLTLDERTGWWDPIFNDEEWDASALRIDPANRWWQLALAILRRGVQEARGKSIVGVGAFGGCGDTLAALRGTNRLLLDVINVPEQVRAAELVLMDMWCEVYEVFYQLTRDEAEGSACWFPFWSPGRFYAAQNDFGCMISRKMFGAIFMPAIERQLQYLDHAVYHVDGVNAFHQVPALLELPRLQAFQIAPQAGQPGPLHFLDTLRLVQSKGKNLEISLPPEEVETALDLLSARGLFIFTRCESEEQARTLLKNAEKWSHD